MIFFFVEKNEKKMIPIYFLQKTTNNEIFKSLFLKQLSEYVIDYKTIFSETKNNKFCLLEQMNENNFFKEEYKEKTISFINEAIDNKDNIEYINLVIIYYNSQKVLINEQYYSKIIKLLDNDQLN